jgi:chromosome segregation ATPase
MNRAGKSLIVLLVAAVGLWGCSQATSGQAAAQAERIKALEAKCGKLEDDYKSAAAARDQARKRVSALEEEHTQMEEQQALMQKDIEAGKLVAKERDDLRQQMEVHIGERDMLQTRCDKLKKGLQSLLGQDDALAAPAHPATPAAVSAGGL